MPRQSKVDMQLVLDEMCRLAYRLHDGQFGPSFSEWDIFTDYRPCGASHLYKVFDVRSWREILAQAGLRSGTKSEYQQAHMERVRQIRDEMEDEPIAPCVRPSLERPMQAIKRVKTYFRWQTHEWVQSIVYELR